MLLTRLTRPRCHEVAQVLQSYLDGEIDTATATMVAEHLEECRRCGLDFRTYREVKAAVAAADLTAHPVDIEAVARLRRFARALSEPQRA